MIINFELELSVRSFQLKQQNQNLKNEGLAYLFTTAAATTMHIQSIIGFTLNTKKTPSNVTFISLQSKNFNVFHI